MGFLRGVVEFYLFDHRSFDFAYHNFFSHRFELSLLTFYIPLFFIGCIVIAGFTGKSIIATQKLGVPFYTIILTPPLLDRLLGNTAPYVYLTNITGFSGAMQKWPGIFGIIFLAILICGIYVYITAGLIRAIGAVIVITGLYTIFATTFPIKFSHWLMEFRIEPLPLELEDLANRLDSFNSLTFLLLSVSAIYICYKIDNPTKLRQITKAHFRPYRLIHYILLAILGYSLLGAYELPRLFLLFCTLVTGTLVFNFSILINDLWDYKVDSISNKERGMPVSPLSVDEVKKLSILFLIFSFLFAFFLSRDVLNIVILMSFLAYTYSAPPFRLRKYIFSSVIIGLLSGLCVLLGYLSQVSIYNINVKVLVVSGAIFTGMTLGSNIIDLKDLAGDSQFNISSLVVKFGLKKARMLTSVLSVIGYAIVSVSFFSMTKNHLFLSGGFLFSCFMFFLIVNFENSNRHWRKIFLTHYLSILSAITLFVVGK